MTRLTRRQTKNLREVERQKLGVLRYKALNLEKANYCRDRRLLCRIEQHLGTLALSVVTQEITSHSTVLEHSVDKSTSEELLPFVKAWQSLR